MHKQIGAILLVSGTCIGSGMIALPMVLAKIGIIPSIALMLFVWFIMYYTSLLNLELNLQAKRGLSLGALGRLFSGKKAELIGIISLKLLSYSLLAVFIYGGSSILQELIFSKNYGNYSFHIISICYAFTAILLLLLPIKFIDYFNRLLFVGLLGVIAILLGGLALNIDWTNLPLISQQSTDPSRWASLLPVVFTSFGFQVIFHTLANYCDLDGRMLKKAFFWGSLIPAVIYILWTCSILSVVYEDNPLFYDQMANGKVEIGELIQVLSSIAHWPSVQLLVWIISLLAIATSVIGVGIGLCDSINGMLSRYITNAALRNLIAAVTTVLPAYLVVMIVPNAFITVLGFAGMILAVIAILLPVYLFKKLDTQKLHYPELSIKPLIWLSTAVGVLVIACELLNMT